VGRPAPTSARLLNRDRELGEILECLDAARSGAGSALVVEGPGGIGKTELLLAAGREARQRGMCVLSARGAELEREFAFGVVRQLFEGRVHGPGGAELMDGAAALCAPVFELTERGEEDERSFAVLHGLYWLCASVAEQAPLLVLVDDAHWSDPPSLAFLAYLARRVEDLPVAVAVASRPGVEEIEEGLVGQSRAVLVRPAPLTRAAVGALLAADTGEDPDDAFVDACLTATEGNPFLVGELVRELGEHGIGSSAEDAERVRELGPRTVARRLLARLGRVSSFSVEVVRAVAVLGADAEVRRIARLTELSPEDVTAALDALVAAEVLAGERPVGFVHPIARSAIYAAIPAGERARLHAVAAALLREEGAPSERIASHLLLTEPAGDRESIDFMVAAARGALARGAPSSAASYLRRALAEPPDRDDRPALLAELGSAESLVGDPRAIGHLREALQSSSDSGLRRAAALALARFLVLSGETGRAASIFESAATGPERWELRLEASAVSAGVGDVNAAPLMRERIERLRARAERDADVPAVVFAALAIADAQTNRPAEEAAELARRAIAGSQRRGLGWATGLVAVFTALLFSERYDEASELVEEGFEIVRAHGSEVHFAMCSAMRSCLGLRRGAPADAEEDARAALIAAPHQAHGFYGMFALASLLESLVERGRPEEAQAELERIGVPRRASAATYGALIHARGRLRLAQGRVDDALEDFQAAGRHFLRGDCTTASAAPWRSDAALAQLALGRCDAAQALAEEEVECASKLGAPRALGIALRAHGLVTGEGGLALLEASVEALERSQASLELSRSLAELGAALRRCGRRAEAREPLRRALDLATRCGADPLAQRAETELRASGARPRHAALSGPQSLTVSERRVAEMAAQGSTNRQIAQALFVSLRTVETHLTHAFRKLGIDSRTELGEALGRTTT
jgi:DNA-binding CsgD family transcriptional regulator/predicted negative regulator of RcsB-dependent stress response